jgi:hypothetical protein
LEAPQTMTKLNVSLGMLLIGSAIFAGNFTACSKSSDGTGTAGTSGAAGTGAAGTGAAGTGAAGTGAGTAGTTGMSAMKPDGTCVNMAYKRTGSTVCTCQDGTPDVCGDTCTDVTIDVANCGHCANACPATAACNGGVCNPAPAAVLPAIAGCSAALTIATGGTKIYYADATHGVVSSVGAAMPISSAEMGATWIATQGTNVLWYNATTKTIRMSAAGAAPTTVYTNTSTVATDIVGGFVSDGTNVYISLGTKVIKVLAAGTTTTPTVVATEVDGIPKALALNGTSNLVYPTFLNGDVDAPKLMPATLPASCGVVDPNNTSNAIMTDCARLARSQGQLFDTSIFVVNGTAFWIDGANVTSEAIGAVGGTNNAISTASDQVTAFGVSTDTIYFASGMTATGGVIEKAKFTAKPSDLPVLVARSQNAPTSLALDATKVYWANGDCSIWSAAK